jgi:inner membrane protein
MFGVFLALLLFKYFENKWLFIIMILIGSVVPDLDSKKSSYGRHLVFRPLQIFLKHRGAWHSLLIAGLLSIFIGWFGFDLGLGFFIGFMSHLLLDGLTKDGIRLLWPFKIKFKGFLRSGGRFDELLLICLLVINIIIFLKVIII